MVSLRLDASLQASQSSAASQRNVRTVLPSAQRRLSSCNGLRQPSALPVMSSVSLITPHSGSLASTGSRRSRSRPLRHVTHAMNIVFVAAEVAPWSKTGGLGDVVGGLPIELAKRGHKVYSIAPRYDQYKDAWDTGVVITVDGQPVRFFHTKKKGVDRIWVDHPAFLAKVWGKTGSKLYGKKSGADFLDNQKRFKLFNQAAIEALTCLPFSPGEDTVIVCNDWHTSLLPVLLKDVYQPRGQFLNTKTAMCVHNIAFQGRFWRDSFESLGLPHSSLDKFLFEDGNPRVYTEDEPDDDAPVLTNGKRFQKINWLKAGFKSADKILTVSPNYAEEIAKNESLGVELDDVIRELGGVEGIVNGMDTDEWSPAKDKYLDVKYDAKTVKEGKALAKETLQAELGLPADPKTPLFGFIGRLEEQKGVDILFESLPKVLPKADIQVAVLGTGRKKLETQVEELESKFPKKVKGVVKFDAPLAHQIIAGADFMLIPSRFEPCGLIQLHAMNYGTVPLVSTTGGLVDTVKEGETGFHIGKLNPDKLIDSDAEAVADAVARAANSYKSGEYDTMSQACIAQDLSWEKPARKWEAILEEIKTGSASATAAKNAVTTPVNTPAGVR